MTKIYVKIIKNTRNGKEEVFRTTKLGYVPDGWELVMNLYDFAIGGASLYKTVRKEHRHEHVHEEETLWVRRICVFMLICADHRHRDRERPQLAQRPKQVWHAFPDRQRRYARQMRPARRFWKLRRGRRPRPRALPSCTGF